MISAEMNRDDFRQLSRIRLKDARVLLKAKRIDAAYHMTGLAVECAFKACIAKKTRANDFPDKEFAAACWTHKFTKLVRQAGLELELDKQGATDPAFAVSWSVIKDWDVESRYTIASESVVRDFCRAAMDSKHGVIKWLRNWW